MTGYALLSFLLSLAVLAIVALTGTMKDTRRILDDTNELLDTEISLSDRRQKRCEELERENDELQEQLSEYKKAVNFHLDLAMIAFLAALCITPFVRIVFV